MPRRSRNAGTYPLLVPVLRFDELLPLRPRRVTVAGTSGSGKTTTAAAIGHVLEVPHVETDSLFHGPQWTRRPTFETDVREVVATPEWVMEWQASAVRPLLAAEADLVVWLDLPRSVVMRQVLARTLRRRLRREVLWSGNVEPPLHTFFTDREHIVRWAWDTHDVQTQRMQHLIDTEPEQLVVRLRSRAQVNYWLVGPLGRAARAT